MCVFREGWLRLRVGVGLPSTSAHSVFCGGNGGLPGLLPLLVGLLCHRTGVSVTGLYTIGHNKLW